MRLLCIAVLLSFSINFFMGCSEETSITETIVSIDTIKVGHDDRLVGEWLLAKYVSGGVSTSVVAPDFSLLMGRSGGYTDEYVETQGNGIWETKGDSLKFESTQTVLSVGKKRTGTFSVTSEGFTYLSGGKTWYYQKK